MTRRYVADVTRHDDSAAVTERSLIFSTLCCNAHSSITIDYFLTPPLPRLLLYFAARRYGFTPRYACSIIVAV